MVAGTVELRVGERSVESPRTTVEAPVLQRMMALAVEEGVGAASLEASSHAIVLHRLDGFAVDVAGFTNLQRDHLDFHKTMEGYLEAKAQLFTPEHARRGVVCVDDQWGAALAAKAPIEIDRVRAYPGDTPADWWVGDAAVSLTDSATTFTLHGPDGEKIEASCPLPGLVNVQNAALALVMAIRAGVPAATAGSRRTSKRPPVTPRPRRSTTTSCSVPSSMLAASSRIERARSRIRAPLLAASLGSTWSGADAAGVPGRFE